MLALLLLLRVMTILTSSGEGMVDREAEKGRRLESREAFRALRVPGMYVAGGRSSRYSLAGMLSEDSLE